MAVVTNSAQVVADDQEEDELLTDETQLVTFKVDREMAAEHRERTVEERARKGPRGRIGT